MMKEKICSRDISLQGELLHENTARQITHPSSLPPITSIQLTNRKKESERERDTEREMTVGNRTTALVMSRAISGLTEYVSKHFSHNIQLGVNGTQQHSKHTELH